MVGIKYICISFLLIIPPINNACIQWEVVQRGMQALLIGGVVNKSYIHLYPTSIIFQIQCCSDSLLIMLVLYNIHPSLPVATSLLISPAIHQAYSGAKVGVKPFLVGIRSV